MSKLMGAVLMLPIVILAMVICEMTIGRVIDQIGYAALSIDAARPAWTTGVLDLFPQFHFVTFVIPIVWLVYAALCAISDAAYTRGVV